MKTVEAKTWRLTDGFAKKLPPIPAGYNSDDYIFFDEKLQGFGLRVRDGRRTWIVQYRVRGKTKRRRLGAAEGPRAIEAKDARIEADIKLSEVTLGANPQSSRDSLRFGATAERYLAGLRSGKIGIGRDRSRKIRPRTLEAIESHFELHWAEFNNLPLHEINRKAIADRIREIADSGPAVANRARASLSGFFRWAVGEGIADANAVIGTNTLPENQPRKRTLDDAELVDVWNACRDDDYGRIIKLLIITGQRRQEVAGIAESEIDLAQRLWRLPDARTKNRREHEVPLSDAALEVIATQPRRVGRDLLFGEAGGAFSGWSRAKDRLDARIATARKEAGRKPMVSWSLHDLRRTMRTNLAKLKVLPHVAEACINHLPSTLVQTYDRHPYQEEKRTALEVWAEHVKKLAPDKPSNVIKIARAR
jgi:integrase